MPERVIMVRESEWREMREALRDLLELVQDQPNETDLAFGITEIEPCLKVDGSTRGVIARARAALAHPTPDGCGREWKQIEAAARAIADAWGETWECCCTEERGLDCDCGYAMTDERDGCDERLTRGDCRKAARAALSALTAGGDDG